MPAGTFNCHGRWGAIVKDPTWTMSYKGEVFGGYGSCGGLELEWVFYAVTGVTFGEVKKKLKEDKPVILFQTDSKIVDCSYTGEGWNFQERGRT